MPRETKKKTPLKLPDLRPGSWRGEILGGCTVNFGQVVQPGPPRQSVEFTYIAMPAAFTMPEVPLCLARCHHDHDADSHENGIS